MKNGEAKFFEEAADELRQLSFRAPDIADALRRFADYLDRIAAESKERDGTDEAA